MTSQNHTNFNRIATAIRYIQQNFKNQPNLDEIAAEVKLSPYHFQRLFSEWAGVSPKSFLQYISAKHAMQVLQNDQASVLDAAYDTGLSGTGRLHDLFVKIQGMTPGEYKNGGENLTINYSYSESPFGEMLIASTPKGICYMGFIDEDKNKTFNELVQRYPNAKFQQQSDIFQKNAMHIYKQDWSNIPKLKLHLKATDFQLNVWEALLKIPMGKLTTYGNIANTIDNPNASRAVGTAIGSNPVGFLIPCHRVIKSNGESGGYMWGSSRKSAIIGWEAAKKSTQHVENGII